MPKFGSPQLATAGRGTHVLAGVALMFVIEHPASATDSAPVVDVLDLPHCRPLSVDMLAIPAAYQADDLMTSPPPARDFRLHPRSRPDTGPDLDGVHDGSLLRNDSLWERLANFRSRDRVRVMTLWETGGSSLSLQAGRRGDPSVQWTSRLMNHGGATRGLLDELLNTSLGGIGKGLRWVSRTSKPEPTAVPAALTANTSGESR